jgi:hypothetical protein
MAKEAAATCEGDPHERVSEGSVVEGEGHGPCIQIKHTSDDVSSLFECKEREDNERPIGAAGAHLPHFPVVRGVFVPLQLAAAVIGPRVHIVADAVAVGAVALEQVIGPADLRTIQQ